ncbi:MAG: EF-hand domain-containing protein [Rhodocyclaceae bacterium]|nr:EF-hand domain-containing protein [Rhodocyclaceae bacterium]
MLMQATGGRRRPDPEAMAEQLFSRLDTDNQGYIEQADLEAALATANGSSETSGASSLFAQLDGDGDGKVTKDEFSTALKAVAEQLDSQFAEMRMQGGMPPPPPPLPQDDAGFSKEELENQLSEIGDSDSKRSGLISKIVENFDAADTDGDGKVSFMEAMAYDQANGAASAESGASSATKTVSSEQQLMLQIMRLAEAYGLTGENSSTATIAASA